MLYKIQRKDEWEYDEYDSAVIKAPSVKAAREYAAKHLNSGCGSNVWLDPKISTCKRLYEPCIKNCSIIVASFQAG